MLIYKAIWQYTPLLLNTMLIADEFFLDKTTLYDTVCQTCIHHAISDKLLHLHIPNGCVRKQYVVVTTYYNLTIIKNVITHRMKILYRNTEIILLHNIHNFMNKNNDENLKQQAHDLSGNQVLYFRQFHNKRCTFP